MQESTIRQKAVETLELEARCVAQLTARVDEEFDASVSAILYCRARIFVT